MTLVAVLLAGCGLLPGGVGRERAIAITAAESGLTNQALMNAYESHVAGGTRQVLAWVVTFRGDYLQCDGPGIPGQAGSQPCRIVKAQAVVHVESATGRAFQISIESPPRDLPAVP